MELYDSVLNFYPYSKDNVRNNCAEGMLKGIDEFYNLNISEDAKIQMKSFGGGLNIGDVCGLLIGAYAGLAHLNKQRGFKDDLSLSEVCVKYNEMFKKEFETTDCRLMKPESGGCAPIAKRAAIIFSKLIHEVL